MGSAPLSIFLLATTTTAPPAASGGGLDENLVHLTFVVLILVGAGLAALLPRAPALERSWGHTVAGVGKGSAFAVGLLAGLVLATGVFAMQPSTPGAAPVVAPAGPGRDMFVAQGCGACHAIAGVSTGALAPPLDGVASRPTLAGTIPNTHENLVKWIMDPPSMKPGTIMPKLGLTEEQATTLAQFLEQLR